MENRDTINVRAGKVLVGKLREIYYECVNVHTTGVGIITITSIPHHKKSVIVWKQ